MTKQEKAAMRRLLVALAGVGLVSILGQAWAVWQAVVAAMPAPVKCLVWALISAGLLAWWAGKAVRR